MPPSLLEKSALTSSEWSDRHPEVKIKPFRLEAFFSKQTQVSTQYMKETLQRFRLKDTEFDYVQEKNIKIFGQKMCACVHVLLSLSFLKKKTI